MRNHTGYIDLILAVTLTGNEGIIPADLTEKDLNRIDEFLIALGNGPKSGRSYAQILSLRFGLLGQSALLREIAMIYQISTPAIKKQVDSILKRLRNEEMKFFHQFCLGHREELKKPITLNDPIRRLYMPEGVNIVLRNGGLKTVRDLTSRTEAELLKIKNFKRKYPEEVNKALKENNFRLEG